MTDIPAQCFYGCDELSNVTIPQSVKSIGDRAFMNCAKLPTAIKDGKTDISDAADLQMFLAEYELTNPIGEIIIE